MQFRRLRFEKFAVTIFTAHAGEERVILPSELTRGMTDAPAISHLLAQYDDARPLHTIPVFTKGGFEALSGDHPPSPRPAGTGAVQFVRGVDNYRMRATEEGSEYHCITPRGEVPQYWQRSFVSGKAGDTFEVLPNEYLYIAEGSIELVGKTFTGPTMLEITKPHTATITEPVLGVKMWL